MIVEACIMVFPEPPSEPAAEALRNAAANWNRTHVQQFSEPIPTLLQLRLDTSLREYEEVLAMFHNLRSRAKLQVEISYRRIYDEQDYLAAAFVEISGVDLGEPDRPFVLNADEALGPAVPCPSCGWQDPFNAPQRAPFEIDEALLDEPLPDSDKKPLGGWDCVDLPNGHKLVSQNVLALFGQGHVSGYELLPVLVRRTGRKSTGMFQILSHRAILVPCNQHESGISYCPTCGAVLDRPEDRSAAGPLLTPQPEFRINQSELAGDELFSRHPSRGAMLYLGQRPYRMLREAPLNGIISSDTAGLCERS